MQQDALFLAVSIDLGNMMECWSGGRYRSTLHRVHPPLDRERYSIAHFATPDYDTLAALLAGTVADGREPPRPIHAGRNLAAFVARFDGPPSRTPRFQQKVPKATTAGTRPTASRRRRMDRDIA